GEAFPAADAGAVRPLVEHPATPAALLALGRRGVLVLVAARLAVAALTAERRVRRGDRHDRRHDQDEELGPLIHGESSRGWSAPPGRLVAWGEAYRDRPAGIAGDEDRCYDSARCRTASARTR